MLASEVVLEKTKTIVEYVHDDSSDNHSHCCIISRSPEQLRFQVQQNVADCTATSRYSSGSTVISLALASRIYHGIDDVRAFLSNKTTNPKLRLMQFFGLDM
jgi:hypothetical protein